MYCSVYLVLLTERNGLLSSSNSQDKMSASLDVHSFDTNSLNCVFVIGLIFQWYCPMSCTEIDCIYSFNNFFALVRLPWRSLFSVPCLSLICSVILNRETFGFNWETPIQHLRYSYYIIRKRTSDFVFCSSTYFIINYQRNECQSYLAVLWDISKVNYHCEIFKSQIK